MEKYTKKTKLASYEKASSQEKVGTKNTHKLISRISVCAMILMLSLALASVAFATQTGVNLGTAGNFEILSKTGISTTGTTAITGNIGVSPAAATFITGFGLIADSTNTYATSPVVTGKIYAADYTPPTPTILTTAIGDMQTAYTDAAGRTLPDKTELGSGNIDGMTLSAGLYKWGTGVTIPTHVAISGGPNDVWIFQIAQDLTVGNGAIVTLAGGAQAKNIFWQVAGQTTIGTTAAMKGIILSQTAIILKTGATLNGKALAQTAVTLDSNAVSLAATVGSASPVQSVINPVMNKSQVLVVATPNATSHIGTTVGTAIKPNATSATVTQTTTANSAKQSEGTAPRKDLIMQGDYTDLSGQELHVRELSRDLRELREGNISAQTALNVTADTDSRGKTQFSVKLHNGSMQDIKIMPQVASQKAIEALKRHACSTANNCTVELKYTGNGRDERVQYDVQLDEDSKIFGFINHKMHVHVDVDAQTGAVDVHKPWWSFAASEQSE